MRVRLLDLLTASGVFGEVELLKNAVHSTDVVPEFVFTHRDFAGETQADHRWHDDPYPFSR